MVQDNTKYVPQQPPVQQEPQQQPQQQQQQPQLQQQQVQAPVVYQQQQVPNTAGTATNVVQQQAAVAASIPVAPQPADTVIVNVSCT